MSVRTWIDTPPWRQISGILLAGLVGMVVLSLLSHSPRDPSWLTSSGNAPANWVGPGGAQISATLFAVFGLASWLVPIAIGAAAYRRVRAPHPPIGRLDALGLTLIALATALLLGAVVGEIDYRGAPMLAGGLVGDVGVRSLEAVVGGAGAMVATITLLAVGLFLAARSPLGAATSDVVLAAGGRIPLGGVARTLLAPAARAGATIASALRSLGRGARDAVRLRAVAWRARRASRQTSAAAERSSEAATIEVPRAEVAVANVDEPAPPAPPPPEPENEQPRRDDRRPKTKRARARERQAVLPVDLPKGSAQLPPADLLDPPVSVQPMSRSELLGTARLIERRCAEFNVEGEVKVFHPGPVVTTFEFRPNAGIRISRISGLADDLALALEAENVRIDRIPSRPTVGVEVPNRRRETISLRHVIESPHFRGSSDLLTLGLGKDQGGEIFCAQLSKMPHLLVAGSTGSGKSVGLNSMIASILFRARPDEVKFILVDPKMLELGVYSGLPHLLVPVVTEMKLASNAFKWAVREMERRYRLLASVNVRHLDSYNRVVAKEPERVAAAIETIPAQNGMNFEAEKLPYIVLIVDELADMLMTTGPEVVEAIARLAQKARAVGIHLILATQRPSVDVLVGAIKANFPARIAFRVASKVDSRTILDQSGAERLLGAGDMLFRHPSSSRLSRVHGAWVSETECLRLVTWLKNQARAEYDESVLADPPDAEPDGEGGAAGGEDPLYEDAVRVVVAAGQGSTSFLQRRMRLGYSRAARIVDQLEENGILGPADGSKPRPCLVGPEYLERLGQIREDEERDV